MLEEKLRQASEASARNRNRMISIFIVVLVLCIAVALSWFNFSTEQTSSGESQPVYKVQPAPEPSTANQSTVDLSTTDLSELRAQFMQRLQAYESDLEPELAGANLKIRNPEKDIQLAAVKQAALSAFAMGEYAAAVEKLSALEALANSTLQQRDALFASAMDGANAALAADDYTAGKLHITNALQLKQDDPQAQALEKRIEALPELLALLKRADIAGIENNPEKEYAALVQAADIAPDREGLKQRRDLLAESIRERQFSTFIARGLVSVEKREISAARSHYKKAAALFPGRSELQVLNAAIRKVSAELDLKQAVEQGNKAIAADDWPQAQALYLEASKRHGKEKRIIDGLQLANKMVSLHQSLSAYIKQPERLSSRNVFKAAQDHVMQADIFASNSKSLAAKNAMLKELLASMDVKLPVFVKSDNQTYILVRGVGKVGLTSGREIMLKPGEYIFEGSRPGYKSRLVQLRLPVGATSLSVEVVCDERI